MEYKVDLKSAPGRDKVEVLGGTFEEGKPEGEDAGKWRQKLASREQMLKYLGEELISCMKCHLCNTVCPVCDPRVSQGPYGMNRSIYYALKWGKFNEYLRDIVYSCSTCGKCVEKCKAVSRALPLIEIIETARELLLVEKMQGPMPDQTGVLKNIHVRGNVVRIVNRKGSTPLSVAVQFLPFGSDERYNSMDSYSQLNALSEEYMQKVA